jgi:glucosamine-6-phosphate deaminase
MTGPTIMVVDDQAALDEAGATLISAAIRSIPDASIVVATGRTPVGTCRLLAGLVAGEARTGLDVTRLRVFQLDEYLGVGAEDERSLWSWMMRSFVTPLGISPGCVVGFDAIGSDTDRSCREYDDAVSSAGGFDLAILGLGPNGHLGFNEPPSDASSPTRVVRLSPESVVSNGRYWGRPVPERALTAGLSSLLAARRVVLLVSGESKRDILARTLGGPPTPLVPASFLQQHPDVHVIVDRAAWGGSPD